MRRFLSALAGFLLVGGIGMAYADHPDNFPGNAPNQYSSHPWQFTEDRILTTSGTADIYSYSHESFPTSSTHPWRTSQLTVMNRWNDDELYDSSGPPSSHYVRHHQQSGTVALSGWHPASQENVPLCETTVSTPATGDGSVIWMRKVPGDKVSGLLAPGIPAIAYSCYSATGSQYRRPVKHYLAFNPNEQWYTGTGTTNLVGYDLKGVAMQEFGHTMGWQVGDDGDGHLTNIKSPNTCNDTSNFHFMCGFAAVTDEGKVASRYIAPHIRDGTWSGYYSNCNPEWSWPSMPPGCIVM